MPQNIVQTSLTTTEKRNIFATLFCPFESVEPMNDFRVVHSWAGVSSCGLQFSAKKKGVQVLHGCTLTAS